VSNRRLIRAEKVGGGMFSSERTVRIKAGGRIYNLIVDEQDVRPGNLLEVTLVGEQNGTALVDLPRETFSSGARIEVPASELLPLT
jgi:hypothetical protein